MINAPADKLLNCATLIKTKSGKLASSATGFFFDFHIDGQRVPTLVTNRHVLKDFNSLQFFMRVSPESDPIKQLNTYHRVTMDLKREDVDVFFHPQDDIDLALIPMAPAFHMAQEEGSYIACSFIPETTILSDSEQKSLSAIEELIMVGCPRGIYDHFNHLPIIRRGITASHPSYWFNGEPVFLSDIACFPGSSGSPIFLYYPFGYPDYEAQVYNFGKSRIKLLGIQSRAYTLPSTGEFINLAIAQNARMLLNFKPILSRHL